MSRGIHTISDVRHIPLVENQDVRGNLTPIESSDVPFDIGRVYFVYDVPSNVMRGDHAHYRTEQVFIAICGTVRVECFDGFSTQVFVVDSPDTALYIPEGIWVKNYFTEDAILCVITNSPYVDRDYIIDRKIFKRWKRGQPFFGAFESFEETGYNGSLENSDWLETQISLANEPAKFDKALDGVLGDGSVVVDWGGALGQTYLSIRDKYDIDIYHIIETPTIVEAGKSLFSATDKIEFYDTIPAAGGPWSGMIDVVYSRSAIQYVCDWRSVLKQLSNLGANHLVLSDILAGDLISGFVGIQNWYGHFIPVWFLKAKEVIACLPQYRLAAITVGDRLDMSNYPEHKRVKRTCNLIFEKKESWSLVDLGISDQG